MKTSLNFKKLALAGIFAAGLTLVGCFQGEDKSSSSDATPVHVNVHMGIGGVNALEKGSTIKLAKMIVVLISNGTTPDTLRDTITTATSPALNTTSTSPQTINKSYSVKPLRKWKIRVSVLDSTNTITHIDTSTAFGTTLLAADTLNFNLSLSSKYTMYDAKFVNIPDSVSSATGATGAKQVLQIKRLVLKIDGVTVRDSSAVTFFPKLNDHILSYDYVTVGSHSVRLMAYGPMGSSYTNPSTDSLFAGTTTINVAAAGDSTIALTLGWVGPTTGKDSISVTIGKVGKVIVNGTTPCIGLANCIP